MKIIPQTGRNKIPDAIITCSEKTNLDVVRKVLSNTGYIILGNFLNKLISLLILVVLTRNLGVADFGKYSLVVFYITFFGIFTDLGLNTVLVRECVRHPEISGRLLGNGIMIRFAYTLISILIACLFIVTLGYPSDVRQLIYIASLMLFFSFRGIFFRQVFEVAFQVHLKMQYPSIINVLNELLTLVIIFVVIAFNGTLTHIILAMTLINLPGFFAIWYFSRQLIQPVFEFDLGLIHRMMREGFPLGISGLLENLLILFPVLILSKLADDVAVGHYSLAFRLAASLWIIPTAFMMSLYPFLSQYAQESRGNLKQACFSGLKVMAFLAIPMTVLVVALARPLIKIISGIAYEPAAPALQLLMIATALYFLNTVFAYTFSATGLQKKNLIAWVVIIVSTLLLTPVLTPFWGFKGAAASVLVSIFSGFVSYAYMAARILGIDPWKMFLKFSIAAMVMGLIVAIVGMNHLLLGSLLAIAAYMAAIFVLNILSKEDYAVIRMFYARSI